ncbi:hypothetical protein E2C01_057779 [Portunus trituberculatus]|uniref:Uncharacterized protein n=1 Tax=Portunus trituberculatus TaxID=210409 RepID=A0A5B7H2Y1_PORTR|nr:hypothetical protein [Portunus trituberculatus]
MARSDSRTAMSLSACGCLAVLDSLDYAFKKPEEDMRYTEKEDKKVHMRTESDGDAGQEARKGTPKERSGDEE